MSSQITRTDLAWVAGLIDGDGCITMNKQTNGSYRKPMVVVDNCDEEILDSLVEIAGGSLVTKKKYQDHHRQAYSWRLYGADNVIGFLREILPYMRCQHKIDRARMLVEEYKVVTHRNGRYNPEARLAKEDFETRFMSTGFDRGSRSWSAD